VRPELEIDEIQPQLEGQRLQPEQDASGAAVYLDAGVAELTDEPAVDRADEDLPATPENAATRVDVYRTIGPPRVLRDRSSHLDQRLAHRRRLYVGRTSRDRFHRRLSW